MQFKQYSDIISQYESVFFQEVTFMPNIKSAKKRVKVTNSKNMQNKVFKSAMRTNLKKLNAGIEAKDAASLNEAYKIIDKAAAKGIMHKNTAANKKAKLAAQFNA